MDYCGFSKKLLPSLVCQKDGYALRVSLETGGDIDTIHNGILECVECGQQIRIQNGIVEFLTTQNELDSVLQSEIVARDESAASYDERLAPRFDKEIPSTLREMGNTQGKKVIEYGCGTGRLTTEISSPELLLASDFSLTSLHILSQKLVGRKNIGLVLDNAITFKTARDFFDIALSAQVYEHIPTEEERRGFLKNVNNTHASGGRFVASMYHQDVRRKIQKKPQEGYHSSKIFFHYFSRGEIKKEFSKEFDIRSLKNIDITLPLEVRFGLTKYFKGGISRFFENIPLLRLFGHLILVTGIKTEKPVAHYGYGFVFPRLLRKEWFWFRNPYDVAGVAMVNFFSYTRADTPGFHRKEALTTVVDLTLPLDTIWQNMRKDFICKQIVKGEKNGIVVKQDTNFKEFKEIYSSFRKQKKLPKDNYRMLSKNGILFSAYLENNMIGGGVFISDGKHMRAWVLASSRNAYTSSMREKIGQANRMIIWEAIKYAKQTGHTVFDLGGIDPESKKQENISLSEFKEGFGGSRLKCYYYFKIYSPLIKLWMRLRR